MHHLPEIRSSLEILRRDVFGVMHEINMVLDENSAKSMVQGIGLAIFGAADILRSVRADTRLLHGDRGEMLAGSLRCAKERSHRSHVGRRFQWIDLRNSRT
jgi:UDP-N-acetylglucosamine 2-epimerase